MAGAYSIPDLDLDKLEHTDDPGVIVAMIQNLIQQDSNSKIWAARQWMESFFQYGGLRDIGFRGTANVLNNTLQYPGAAGGRGNSSGLRRRVPKVFKAVQIQAANQSRQRPTINCWPVNESEESSKDAKLANIVLDYFWDKDQEDDLSHESVLWALLTPMVARIDYLDYSFNKNRIWPKFKKDPNTGMLLPDPEVDAHGKPILEQLPWNKTDIIPAFRLIVGSTEGSVREPDFVTYIQFKRLSWLHDNYLKNAPGYYPYECENVSRGTWQFTALMAMEMAIRQVGFGGLKYYRNGYGFGDMKDVITIATTFIRPSKNYPTGRKIAIANGSVVFDGASDAWSDVYETWHPGSFLSYEKMPGRVWGTSYAEKITSIATAYEQGRTEFDKLRRTFSVAKMSMPIGSEIDVDTITGDEQILRYNAFGPDGGKPAYLNAPQPPTTIVDDIKMTQQDFVEGSGVTEIMQGIRPQGVTTFRGLEILKEEGNNAQAPFIRMNESYHCRAQMQKLENIRKCLVYPDQNMANAIRIFKKMTNYVTDVEIGNFVGKNLLAMVKIEPDSSIAKSKLAQQEKLITMAGQGALGDIVNDPDLNREYKQKMGVSGFETVPNQHVAMAKHENEQILSSEKMGKPIVPPVYPWQDDAIHIRLCEKILNDPTMQGKQLIMEAALQHRQMHEQQQAMKFAQQLQQQMMMNEAQMPDVKGKPKKGLTQKGQNDKDGEMMFGPSTGGGANQGEAV